MPTPKAMDQQRGRWFGIGPRVAGASDVGSVRRVNQDAFARFDRNDRGEILLVVADGLGGHRGGEVASRLAVETLGERVFEGESDPATRLALAVQAANEVILAAARQDDDLKGMGTTIVCLLLAKHGDSQIAHVGDSRLYRLRGERLQPMTEDHSLVATLVREHVLTEEEARDDPRRNQILRALGVREQVEIELKALQPRPGDAYLLCSDGLHGLISDEEIEEIVGRRHEPERIVAELIVAALEAGGNDNVTCLLARIPESALLPALRGLAGRLRDTMRSWLHALTER